MENKQICPHCQKPVADEAYVCPHCNGPISHTGSPIEKPICPRCRQPLNQIEIEGNDKAETCQNCRGIWLDQEEFRRSTNPQRLAEKYADSRDSWFKPDSGPLHYISCPRCGRLMNRENFSQISGIVIDRCRDHGVWLDAGELERIRLFIGQGGLEKLQDKRLDKLEINTSELAGRTRDLEFMTGLLHVFNLKRFFFERKR